MPSGAVAGELLEVLVGDLMAGPLAAELDGVVEDRAFPYTRALSAKPSAPSWSAFAVGLAQLSFVAVEDDPGDGMAAFAAV